MAEQQHSGWSEGEHGTYAGLFASDMTIPRGGLVTDMPAAGRPVYNPPRVKGVVGATPTGTDEDHRPGGGTWTDV